MQSVKFGQFENTPVFTHSLENDFLKVTVCDFGATVLQIIVKNSKLGDVDVALGFDNFTDLIDSTCYMGSTIGRCANRIKDGKFTLNGKAYQLFKNDGQNHLHGGKIGFNKRLFTATKISPTCIEMQLKSHDGEENYCGNVDFLVQFCLIEGNFCISYHAKSDCDTLFSPTNHTYFNLNGENDGSILDNLLTLNSRHFTPIDDTLVPTGEVKPVSDALDFTVEKPIGQDIKNADSQLLVADGFDHNFCVGNSNHIATVRSKKTHIKMQVFSDRCGVQFYSGNFLQNVKGKSTYNKQSGFCLETQCYPNAINFKNFGTNPVLKQNEKFFSQTIYAFSIF